MAHQKSSMEMAGAVSCIQSLGKYNHGSRFMGLQSSSKEQGPLELAKLGDMTFRNLLLMVSSASGGVAYDHRVALYLKDIEPHLEKPPY